MREIGYKRFALGLTWVLAPLLLIALANVGVDAYGMFGSPRVRGLNAAKPARSLNDRIYVTAELRRVRPAGLVMGTSTARHIDPVRLGTIVRSPAYNLGLSNGAPYEFRRYLEYAIRQGRVRSVVLGLDFLSFNESHEPAPTFSEATFRHPLPSAQSVGAILSVDAIKASISTVLANVRDPELASYDRTAAPQDVRAPGRVDAFRTYLAGVMGSQSLYAGYALSRDALAELERIVALCETNDIRLSLYISPMHASHLDAIYDEGLGGAYDEWIRSVAAIHDVWDFSGYNSITTEPLADTMSYYDDPLHFRNDVGDMILDRVLGRPSPEAPDDFGVLVTAHGADGHLAKRRTDRETWLRGEKAALLRKAISAPAGQAPPIRRD